LGATSGGAHKLDYRREQAGKSELIVRNGCPWSRASASCRRWRSPSRVYNAYRQLHAPRKGSFAS